jgi:hypothetical protein
LKTFSGLFLGRPASTVSPGPILHAKSAHYHARVSVAASRGPPVKVVFPQISPTPCPRGNAGEIAVVEPVTRHHLRTTASPPVRPRPRAVSSFPRACSIASALSTAPLPSSLRQLGCPRQEYNDEALEQAASLAKLPLPKACHVGRRLVLPTCAHSHIGKVR